MAQGKKHIADDTTREVVRSLASFGVTQEAIANHIGINDKSLRKHYSDELKTALMHKGMVVGNFLYGLASGQALNDGANHAECSRAAMFWMKTQMKWRETAAMDHTSSDGSMTPNLVERVIIDTTSPKDK